MSKKVNLIIDQGSTFSSTITLLNEINEPLITTDFIARGQIRKHYASNSATNFTTSLSNGELVISLTAVQTANLAAERQVYDIELVDTVANSVTRVLEGFITITPEVTK